MARSEKNNRGKSNLAHQTGQVRVIGGTLKNSVIRFSGNGALRPTPAAVRETLFNWLDTRVTQSRCLDLFAGTGALGFEAVSRGAKHVTMVEHHLAAANAIRANALRLKISNISIEQIEAVRFLSSVSERSFDIIFLDPPYSANLVLPCLQVILERNILRPKAMIYLETASDDSFEVPNGLIVSKKKRRGAVAYRLLSPDQT